ncbi:MAG: hypothetical protein LKJ69_06875 [Lactobacillus sp.]|nr:hypothetical protein [Lactobacillus sp.]MCI2033113.1 hypothetical protein [Lactobacillus sp.]
MKKALLTLLGLTTLLSLAACSGTAVTDANMATSSSALDAKASSIKAAKESSIAAADEAAKASSKLAKIESNLPFPRLVKQAQASLPALKAQASETYSDITIEKGEGDSLIYNFTYATKPTTAIDTTGLKAALIKESKKAFGDIWMLCPDTKVQANYLNPDKSVAATVTITKAEVDEASRLRPPSLN